MRYTAKARMLSFDFLNDDVVYTLTHTQVMLLAGMIARADNLGRLPGEPGVLLGFLFYPKNPRSDVMPDALEELLMTLARAERIAWYAVDGTRFIEFLRWHKNQPGIREHNRKSTFPSPTSIGAIPVSVPGTTLDMFAKAAPRHVAVGDVVAAHREQSREHRASLDFDSARVVDWCSSQSDDALNVGPFAGVGDWVKFAAWLHKTGTKNMPVVVALLEQCKAARPAQPYAYFKAGTDTRESMDMRASLSIAEAEHQRIKDEEKRRSKAKV